MKLRISSILLTAGLLLAGCGGGPKMHFTQEGVAPKPVPRVAGGDFLERVWRYEVGGRFSAETGVLIPAAEDDLVVVAGPKGQVAALALESGVPRWTVALDETLTAGVGIGDGLVVVAGNTGDIIALDRETGAATWRTNVGAQVLAEPVVVPGVAIVRAGDSRIVGLDTATGNLLWTVQKSVEGLTVRGVSKPLINGRGAVIGLADGRLLAVDVDRGRVLWESPIGSRRGANEVGRLADIDADPTLLGTVLYVASFQSRVVAMALGSPRVIWSSEISTLKNLAVDADRLYVTSENGSIVALNRYTGERVWEQDQLSGRGLTGPLVLGDHLLVGDFEGNVFQMDSASGAIRAVQNVSGGAAVTNPIKVDDLVLVVSESGRIQAFSRR